MIAHHAFLPGMAVCEDTNDPGWLVDSSAFLVLRLFDDWRSGLIAERTREAVYSHINTIPLQHAEVRGVLRRAVRAMGRAIAELPTVVIPLLDLGDALEADGRYVQAEEVFFTVATALMDPSVIQHSVSLAATAYFRHGGVAKLAGDLVKAQTSIAQASELAEKAKDHEFLSTCNIWLADISRARGNLVDAETAFTLIIAELKRSRSGQLKSLALRGRGSTRQLRGNYPEAIRDFFNAYTFAATSDDRHGILRDLAVCASGLGYWTLARDVFMVLAQTARSHYTRSIALVNWLELTVLMNDRIGFTKLRERIAQTDLAGECHHYFRLYSAEGMLKFGKRAVAARAFERTAQLAHDAKVHTVEQLALNRLEEFRREPSDDIPPDAVEQQLPYSFRDIRAAVDKLIVESAALTI